MNRSDDSIDRERLEALFEQVLALPQSEREKFIAGECGTDAALNRELTSLVDAFECAPRRLEGMAEDLLPEALKAISQVVSPVGSTVSHYRIEDTVGVGGMGIVYRARDKQLGRPVALKFLRPHLSGDSDARARLESEARAASALDHPNIAVVYEIGTSDVAGGDPGDECLFIAMAYYAGQTIRQMLTDGPLRIEPAVDYATQVASGLARAHEEGIVHRDIKPANVIVSERGEAKILDFGLARSTEPGKHGGRATRGTVAYMSPEHVRGEGVDFRADQWSFGAMLYEMLTGRPPFRGEDAASVIHAIRHETPSPVRELRPETPPALAAVVETCLQKDPDARYQRSDELLAALQTIGTDLAGRQMPAGRSRSGRLAAAAAGLAGLAIVAGMLLASRDGESPRGQLTAGSPTIAVLPFVPAAPDRELERLGRELAATVASGLDGMGDLETIDAVSIWAEMPESGLLALEEARQVALRLDANHLIHGALARADGDVRLEAAIYSTTALDAVARATVTAGDLDTLTDATVIALLDELWRDTPPDVPSLAALTQSRVPAARRAYLEGELAFAQADMRKAVESFERAFDEDPGFWWAYWRSLYPRSFRDARFSTDEAALERLLEHRDELPEPDRLLVEAWTDGSATAYLEKLSALLDRFPHYEPAAWRYANSLVHHGAYLGYTIADARAAVERFLVLQPDYAFAWDHLAWLAIAERDLDTLERATAEVQRLTTDVEERRLSVGVLEMRADAATTGLQDPASFRRAIDFLLAAPPGLARAAAAGLLCDGNPEDQLRLNHALLERGPAAEVSATLWTGNALAWAARGAWDEALAAADRAARLAGSRDGPAGRYRLAVAGILVGALPAEAAVARRPPERDGPTGPAEHAAELVWLDALLAYLEGQDAYSLAALADSLEPDATNASLLRRSIDALAADARGDRAGAIDALRALEFELADSHRVGYFSLRYPLVVSAHRLLAARWLRHAERDSEAAWLLRWHWAMPGSAWVEAWNHAVGDIALVDRAEIAAKAGDRVHAERLARRFLRVFDAPDPALRSLVVRAEAVVDAVEAP